MAQLGFEVFTGCFLSSKRMVTSR